MSSSQHLDIPSDAFNFTLVAGSVKAAMDKVASRDLWQVPLQLIRTLPEFNVRIRDDDYLAHLRNTANSIKQSGYFQDKPLAGFVAREDGTDIIYLTDGHTRLEATAIANSEGADIKVLPVVIKPRGTSREDLVVALVKSNEGRPLSPYETAIVCKRLIGYGWPASQVAARLDMAETYVDGLLMLIGGPQEIREMVLAGQLSATTAIQTLRQYGNKAIEHLQNGLARAQKSGSHRVTAKHLPGSEFKKQVKKSAPVIYAALKDVTTDPGYSSLSEDLRAKLNDIVVQLKAAETAAADAEVNEAGNDAEQQGASADSK